jgi:hypothetical protein
MRMKFNIILLSTLLMFAVCLISNSYGASANDKYADFKLEPVYGVSSRTVYKESEPKSILTTYAKIFGIDKSFGKGPYLEYESGKFAVMAAVATRDPNWMNRLTSCDFKGDGTEKYLTACGILAGLVDTKAKTVTRLNSPTTLELDDNSMIGRGSRDGFPIYGCYVESPFVAADLNLDGVPELFVFGGLGMTGGDAGSTVARTSLYIFNVSLDKPLQIFKSEITYEEYETETRVLTQLGAHSPYQSFSTAYLNEDGTIGSVLRYPFKEPIQGIRRYAKLYFKDFNKNGKLDILVWRREYKSRLNTDPIKGYKLSRVTYQLYEESTAGFVEQPIQAPLAEKYLKDNNLTWRKGFPWKNLCLGKKSDDPLIDRYQDPKQNINDSVLEH